MMLWDRPHKRRNTVLGYWRQMKLEMWNEYLRRLDLAGEAPEPSAIPPTSPAIALKIVPPSADTPISNDAPQVKPGRIPVRKEILHRGRRFTVTYWMKAPPLAA